ncbi:MAG: ribonuclease P protein component [Chloroflexi bacterium]|nr:ribonuclease P protein component [Chloroflexota bacterium]
MRAARVVASDRALSLRSRTNDLAFARVAVQTGRELGSAVTRNRARRRIREAIRGELRGRGGAGLDLLATARKGALDASPATLRQAVTRALDAALARR